jgi:hypothetical protein
MGDCGCCDLLVPMLRLQSGRLTSLLFAKALHALRCGHDCKAEAHEVGCVIRCCEFHSMIFFEMLLRAVAKSASLRPALSSKELPPNCRGHEKNLDSSTLFIHSILYRRVL